MKTFILSTLLATVLASPAPAPVEATAALTSCVVGQVYCGWYLIDQLGWSSVALRTNLCNALGKCDTNNGDAWNSLWLCTGSNSAWPNAVCGGKDSCAGPAAHCV